MSETIAEAQPEEATKPTAIHKGELRRKSLAFPMSGSWSSCPPSFGPAPFRAAATCARARRSDVRWRTRQAGFADERAVGTDAALGRRGGGADRRRQSRPDRATPGRQ